MSSGSLSSGFLSFRRSRKGELKGRNGTSVVDAAASSSATTPSPTTTAEPLHHDSAAVLHTTSLRDAALALRGSAPPAVPERDNTPLEEAVAVATMAALFGFVFVGPWATLAALVHVAWVVSSSGADAPPPTRREDEGVFEGLVSSSLSSLFGGGGGAARPIPIRLSAAFLVLVSAASFLPVCPSGPWQRFRDSRVWDCWRRYFRMRIVTPPLPFLELEEGDGDDRGGGGDRGGRGGDRRVGGDDRRGGGGDDDETKRKRKAYIFAHYPHGCFPVGSFLSAAGLLSCPQAGIPRDTRPAIASALFRLPVLRQVYTWCACVPCDWRTLSGHLERGTSVAVVPEGIAGIFHGSRKRKLPSPGASGQPSTPAPPERVEERIYTKHKGYIKLALRTGTSIVPVYALGQSRVLSFWGSPALSRKLRLSIGLWWGRWMLPCLPRKEEIVLVVCPPIDVAEVAREERGAAGGGGGGGRADGVESEEEAITQEQIDAVFERVALALKTAHDETKGGVRGWENSEMVFCG